MHKVWRNLLVNTTLLLLSLPLWANNNAVVLLYHHVSESTPAVTSVSPDTFRQHMQYLAKHHNVLPLQEVIEKLKSNQALPEKTVVITFDDGYNNLYHQAHPILKEFGFTYTIFINPSIIGQASYQLTWQQIKQMNNEGATFANHADQHEHLLKRLPNESDQHWLLRVSNNIQTAEQSIQQQLGYSLKYIAYPYGEFDSLLQQKISQLGYIGFGQHSGAIASHSDFTALPRFPAAGIYSKLESLKVKLNSLAMPVSKVTPADPKAELANPPQQISFEVHSSDINTGQINCFQSGQSLPVKIKGPKITVQLAPIKRAGRQRVNCTTPSNQDSRRYYWYSQPIFIPSAQGDWLD